MVRFIGIFVLLSLVLTNGSQSGARSQTSDRSKDHAFLTQNRLVVFEAFMRSN